MPNFWKRTGKNVAKICVERRLVGLLKIGEVSSTETHQQLACPCKMRPAEYPAAMPSIHSIYNQIFKVWRKRRAEQFFQIMAPKPSDLVLDVGGTPWFWSAYRPFARHIDVLNIEDVSFKPGSVPGHSISTIVGDGCHLTMGNGSYDLAFSNSVIEHVGSFERQKEFAAEIRRVGKALWIQTPAYECPIEPHYLTPFIHYLPPHIRKKIARRGTVWGWLSKPNEEQIKSMAEMTRLLRKREMQELFPDCEIMTERLLWFIPKSYIAIRRPA